MNKKLILTIALLTGTAGLSASQQPLTNRQLLEAGAFLTTVAVATYATYKAAKWLFGSSSDQEITDPRITTDVIIVEGGKVFRVRNGLKTELTGQEAQNARNTFNDDVRGNQQKWLTTAQNMEQNTNSLFNQIKQQKPLFLQ